MHVFWPAWIFSDKIIELFNQNIFNYNGIPVPLYLGGAHLWQILNQSRRGGAFIQRITSDVDRGSVVACEEYNLPETCVTPFDYQHYNDNISLKFIKAFIQKHIVHAEPILIATAQLGRFVVLSATSYFPMCLDRLELER